MNNGQVGNALGSGYIYEGYSSVTDSHTLAFVVITWALAVRGNQN